MKKILFFILCCNALSISAQQPDALFVDPSGKIGIGTSSPLSTFHVKGQARLDSNLNILGTLNGTGLSGNSLSLKTPTINTNALRIDQGSFSIGGESNCPIFSIDADNVPGGRFYVNQKGLVTISKGAVINGTLQANYIDNPNGIDVGSNITAGGTIDATGNITAGGTIDATGNITAGGNIGVTGGLTVGTNVAFGNKKKKASNAISMYNEDHSWTIWTSGSEHSVQGLTNGSFELWDYNSTQNNRRVLVLPAGKLLDKAPIIFDSQGNIWIPGFIKQYYPGANWTVEEIIRRNKTGNWRPPSAPNQVDIHLESEIDRSINAILEKMEELNKTIELLNNKNEALQKRVAQLEAK